MKKRFTRIALLTTLLFSSLFAADAPVDMSKRTKELQDLKWGMFICWSFSTFSGKEWTPGITDVSYFKATGCDTDQWARTAKEAEMGYILFLTKHHDGFCLWDTKTTDRKVTKAPLGRDVLAELKKSCDKYGIKLALYFSEGEWRHPGGKDHPAKTEKTGHNGGGQDPEMKKAQLKELLTQYGPIEYIWFDHAVGDGGLSHSNTVEFCKSLQPGCFVGFNHGAQAGADIRLGEMGKPGPLTDHGAAGPHMRDAPASTYRLAEFTYPIQPRRPKGAMWFYSHPDNEGVCYTPEKLYKDYLGAVKYGNVFALDVGPNYEGKLRDIDVKTLRAVGDMIRSGATLPEPIRAFCVDFNWGSGGPNGFAKPGLWADADPAKHVAWYEGLGANVIQTFAVSCNGYAWYKGGKIPAQPGLANDFLPEVVKLGHAKKMQVMGYFCIAANTRWGAEHPDLSYGTPSAYHIPFTDGYLDYLSSAIEESLKLTGMDGFMIDWVWNPTDKERNGKWLAAEKKLFEQLMGQPFPGEDKLTPEAKLAYERKAIDRCWERIRSTAKRVNPKCVIWLSCNNVLHPTIAGSQLLKEVDWVMDESGNPDAIRRVSPMLGLHARQLLCVVGWGDRHDARKICSDAANADFGIYGFAKPGPDSLPLAIENYLNQPLESFTGNDRNIAILARFFNNKPLPKPLPPPITASSVWSAGFEAAQAFDNDEATRWGAKADARSGWLEIDLGKETAIGRAVVMEIGYHRTQEFAIEYKAGNEWKPLHRGTTIAGRRAYDFPTVNARVVRLNILKANEVPSIEEFHVYAPGAKLPESIEKAMQAEQQRQARLKWFDQAKYGLFINWGLYSIPAGEWKGKPIGGIGEWIMHNAKIPVKEYELLAKQFNPTKFNADEWAQLAVDAGMKYLVFDCKHHDGFALYRSAVSAYNCYDATPWKRDPFKELQEACAKRGITFCFYYSQATDWHEPNGANNTWDFAPNDKKDFDQYLRDKSIPQIKELLTNYGPIGLIWFDVPTLMKPERCQQLVDVVRSLQPATLINSRLGPGGLQDYQSRGDNEIPHSVTPGAWETAATINDTWGFKKDDHNWKTPEDICFKLVDIVSKGGNYLLNVGPDGDGAIPKPSQDNLRIVGAWLKINGEAIYGAGRTPFGDELGSTDPDPEKKDRKGRVIFNAKTDWRCTTQPGKLYFHLFKWPGATFETPAVAGKVKTAYLLSDRKPLPVKQEGGRVSVTLPENAPKSLANVLCLDIHEK
jgi:alpha-L-fucosidase